MDKLPIAKMDNLVVQSFDDEVLIYNLADNKAFCLNHTSATVYQACDSYTTFAELQTKSGFSKDLIHLTLSELNRHGFIKISSDYVSSLDGMSRREAIRKVGLATMIALPTISFLTAPLATDAASGICAWTTGCRPAGTIVCSPWCVGTSFTFQNCGTTNGTCGGCSGSSQNVCSANPYSATFDFVVLSVG